MLIINYAFTLGQLTHHKWIFSIILIKLFRKIKMFERIKRRISNNISEKIKKVKNDIANKTSQSIGKVKSTIIEQTHLNIIISSLENKKSLEIEKIVSEIYNEIIEELQYRFESIKEYENPERNWYLEENNKRKRNAKIQIELFKEFGTNLTKKILLNIIRKYKINVLFIRDEQIEDIKDLILDRLSRYQSRYERIIKFNEQQEKWKLQEEEREKQKKLQQEQEERERLKDIENDKSNHYLMQQLINRLGNQIIILDSNIYMNESYENIFNFIMFNRIKNIFMTQQQYDEISNKYGFESRQAKRIIELLSKSNLITIHNITQNSDRNAYADIELINYIREFSSKNHNILFVTDDRDLSIRTLQLVKQDGYFNNLEVLSGNELDYRLINFYKFCNY